MTALTLYSLVGIALFCMGLFGLISTAQLMRKILALNVSGSGVFLFLVAMARRVEMPFPDPVPHAMVLTGIVVAVSATALALVLIGRIHDFSTHPPDNENDRT